MPASLIRGNALRLPLRDRSVHLALSSPPYWSLRQYSDDGDALDGQLGSEPNPWLYLANLWAVMDEVWRALRGDGSCFVNLGDKFSSGGRTTYDTDRKTGGRGGCRPKDNLRPKTRMGLPHRFYEGCVDPDYRRWTEQRAGLPPTVDPPQWVGRMDICLSKQNGLPESVSDRVRASHEYLFHLTKSERYYSALDEIREEYSEATLKSYATGGLARSVGDGTHPSKANGGKQRRDGNEEAWRGNSLGRMPGSVWEEESAGEPWWIGKFGLCPRCGELKVAGNGPPVSARAPGTGSSGSTAEPCPPTESATRWPAAPSQTGNRSTTSAGTGPASTPTTSKLSPSARTCSEATPSPPPTSERPPAATGTLSTPRTLIEFVMEAACAGCACERAIAEGIGASKPHETVWDFVSEPLIVPEDLPQHFAAWPSSLARRIVLGWSPPGVCTACGQGRRPVSGKAGFTPRPFVAKQQNSGRGWNNTSDPFTRSLGVPAADRQTTIIGYACACPDSTAPTTPATVLDFFSGTGTTCAAASALGRHGVGVELSADYNRLATWRIADPGLRAKVLGVDKPAPQVKGQGTLFDGLAS